jgi:hypothetical protein
MSDIQSQQFDDDTPLWGALQIGKVIDRTEQQTNYLLKHKKLPAKKVGNIWTSTRRALRGMWSDISAA